MSFDWGGFGQGLSVGLERGWNLGEKIAETMRKRDFKNSVDQAGKDYDSAKQELDAERSRREASPDTELGSSLEEVKPMTALLSKFKPSGQLSETAIQGLHGALPVDRYSSQPEKEMPKQAIRDLPGAMSDAEYQMHSRALVRDRQRSYLNARMEYASMDPDKFAELQKEQFQMDVNDAIRERAEAAMKGDGNAIGQMVGTLQKMGIIPAGKIERDGDNVVLRNPKTGETIMGGPITPELVQQYIPLYAMAEKALADDNFEQLYRIGKDHRAEGREDQKLALEGDKVNNDKIRTNIAYRGMQLQEAKAAQVGVPNDGLKYKVDDQTGETVGYGADGMPKTRLVTDTDTHEQVAIPYTYTAEQWKAMNASLPQGYGLAASGGAPTVISPDGKAMSFQDFKAGSKDWQDVEQPDATPKAINLGPMQNVAGARMNGGAFGGSAIPQGGAGQGSEPNRAEIPVETADEPKKAIQVDAVSGAAPAVRGVKKAAESPTGTKKETQKKAIEVDAVSRAQPRRYANDVMPTVKAKRKGFGDYLKALQDDARYDTSGYNDKQLAQLNADRTRRGLDPLKAMDKKPKTEGLLARAVRQSRERNAAWDARTKAEQEAKKKEPAQKAIRQGTKKENPGKADPKLDMDAMIVRKGRTGAQQRTSELHVSPRIADRLYPKLVDAGVKVSSLTQEETKTLFPKFGGKADSVSEGFWWYLTEDLKSMDKSMSAEKKTIAKIMKGKA